MDPALTPNELGHDDRLSLLLGRIARLHSETNWRLSMMWQILVGESPARAVQPDDFRELVTVCKLMIADDRAGYSKQRIADAASALDNALQVHDQRSRMLHGTWVFREEDDTWLRGKLARKGKDGSTHQLKVAEIEDLVRRTDDALFRIEYLDRKVRDGPEYPDPNAIWDMIGGRASRWDLPDRWSVIRWRT